GADLSPRMLERARARGLYDALHEAALQDLLAAQPAACWDLLVAIDVFIYVGALDAVFESARRALRPGGRLLCSLECADASAFVLTPAGRYAHSPEYAIRLARAAGFLPELEAEVPLRREHGEMLRGHVLRLRVPG